MEGPRRSGPAVTAPSFTARTESPPMPIDFVFRERTSVGLPSSDIPSGSMSGAPSAKTAMSVVVPPISRMIESSLMSQRATMPMTLAAGPERIDSTGNWRDTARGMVPPSALSMLMEGDTPLPAIPFSTASEKELKIRHTAEL